MSRAPTHLDAKLRAALAADPELGAGDFLWHVVRANPARELPILTFERPVRTFYGREFATLSLAELFEVSTRYAAWYAGAGVKAKDVVSIYLDDGGAYLIHFLALTSLGAIPALINGNMPIAVAAGHVKRIGSFGLYTEPKRERALADLPETPLSSLAFLVTDATATTIGRGEPARLPQRYPYKHHADDPIMIAHSSGTTGIPKPVLLQHQRFFHGIRFRLSQPPTPGNTQILSTLPHSHNCAIAYIMLALLNGTPVYLLSTHTGHALVRAIDRVKPTMVVSFPQTFVELTEAEPEKFDLASVMLWMNGGDAAHETHIRRLVAFGHRLLPDGRKIAGSIFVDGMGSSEMGFSLFRHVHTPETNDYGRCVGKPHDWVDAQVFGEGGERLGAGTVGRLGVRGPSVTSGYWNDSLLTYRTQLDGYWLTGDLVYKDEENRFYHVDRVPDLVTTAEGPLYSLETEELLMRHVPEIADCSVFDAGGKAHALVRLRPEGARFTEAGLRARFNTVLSELKRPLLAQVDVVGTSKIPLGATGKVLKRELRDAYHV